MSSSTPKAQFLLDENVRKELSTFLKEMGISVKIAPKGALMKRLQLFLSKKKG